jgi:hypothetical protein
MVATIEGRKKFCIVETNGGSSRFLSALSIDQTQVGIDSYAEMLRFMPPEPNVLIATLDADLMTHEKFVIAERLRRRLCDAGTEPTFVSLAHETMSESDANGGRIAIGSYPEVLGRITVDGQQPMLDGAPLHGIIGDGVIRRHPEMALLAGEGRLDAVFANKVFRTTDDKYSTYRLVSSIASALEPFGVKPLHARQCRTEEQLASDVEAMFAAGIRPVVIKPHGGSGGAGIRAIDEVATCTEVLAASREEFGAKFGDERDPFPYTVVEAVPIAPIRWRESERTFDVRIYVGRSGDELVPVGLLVRIARSPFRGFMDKESFVVNLSGYGGIEVDRGMGLSTASLNMLGLSPDDIADMLAASCAVFDHMQRGLRP